MSPLPAYKKIPLYIACLSLSNYFIPYDLESIKKTDLASPAPNILALPRIKAGGITVLPFAFDFSENDSFGMASAADLSLNPYWWLRAGGSFQTKNGIGKTIQGELKSADPARISYSYSNPLDTDNGYHPQNVFRLLARGKWQNIRQEIYFKINKINKSSSPNRNESNGVHLLNYYVDSNNVYTTGIRVDGYAAIKKKKGGTYYTLSLVNIYPGKYEKSSDPNLIPLNKWIGIRSEVKTNPDKSVSIKMYLDENGTGDWKLTAEAVDSGQQEGAAITKDGHAGIRTDFMDVEFDDYRLERL